MKKIISVSVMPLLALALVGCSPSTPKHHDTHHHGSPKKVKELISKHHLQVVDKDYVFSKLGKGTKTTASTILVDARPEKKYKARTIPTAINIPDSKFEQYYKQLNKVAKNKEIIVFCGGWACVKSPKVASMLVKKGHSNVKLYQAGEPEWTKTSYSEIGASLVKKAIEQNSALLIDARPHKKYLGSSIPSAINIPDNEFDKLKNRLPADKNTPIITFCGGFSCTKSHKVARELLKLGYTNVSNYSAGMPGWKKLHPTTSKSSIKPKAKKARFFGPIKKGQDEGSVDGEWFLKNYTHLPKNVTLVDVRGSSERKAGFIKGSKHVSLEENKEKAFISKLPKKGYIIFHCAAGGRSMEALERVNDSKLKGRAVYLDANIKCKGNDCKIEPNEALDPTDW